MRKRKGPARRPGGPSYVGRLALVVAALLAVRALSERFDGPGPLISDRLAVALMAAELPGEGLELPAPEVSALMAFLPAAGDADGPKATDDEPQAQPAPGVDPGGDPDPDQQPAATGPDTSGEPQTAPDNGGFSAQSPPPETPENPAVGTTITGESGEYTNLGGGIYVKNRTDYSVDLDAMLEKPLDFSPESSAVLIVHTHGSEAYNPAGEDIYVPSDPSRTEDRSYNVVRLGDELEKLLSARGITVYHDRELHDYPSYAGSYERTLTAINAQLKAHPEICVVIDLHRDALEGDGVLYKTVAHVGDRPSAQVMLICGTNFSGLKHPGWRDNLSFALKLQKAMVTKYPTLARPLKISEYRYNQHATPGSLILEVGTNGNTLQEALTALEYFGDCMGDVLAG